MRHAPPYLAWLSLVVFCALLVLASPTRAEEGRAVVRVSVRPEGELWVGQQATLDVEVLTSTHFNRAPRLRLPSPDGALVFAAGGAAVNTTAQVEGVSMSGTITTVHVVPQRAGPLVVPAFTIEVSVARGPSEESDELLLRTDDVRLIAKLPPGAERISTLISSSRFEAIQKWDTDAVEFVAGGALERRITMRSADVRGMAFPVLETPPIEGVSAYVNEPLVEDLSERGTAEGRRTDTVTYVFGKPGRVTIPTLVITWFDLASETLQRIELDGRTVTVSPDPGALAVAADDDPLGLPTNESTPVRRRLWLGILAVLGLVGVGAHFARPRIVAIVAARRRERELTEAAFFERVVSACERGDARVALTSLYRWIDRISASPTSASLDAFICAHRIDGLDARVADLQGAVIDGPAAKWNGAQLVTALRQAREFGRHAASDLHALLPALNPTDAGAGHGASRRARLRTPWEMIT